MKLIEWIFYLILIFGVLALICMGLVSIRNGVVNFENVYY